MVDANSPRSFAPTVTLHSFQGLFRLLPDAWNRSGTLRNRGQGAAARWTLKQVQGDAAGEGRG